MNRNDIVMAVQGVIDANLPAGFEIAPRYRGMTTWVVPIERCPKTYDGRPLPVVALGERKSYVSLFVMGFFFVPGLRDWLDAAWHASGCPLRRGEASIQLRRLDDIPFDVLAQLFARLTPESVIEAYTATFLAPRGRG